MLVKEVHDFCAHCDSIIFVGDHVYNHGLDLYCNINCAITGTKNPRDFSQGPNTNIITTKGCICNE